MDWKKTILAMASGKRMGILFTFLLVALSGTLDAQPEKFHYRFSSEIENSIEKDTLAWRYQVGASEFSLIGQYQKTRETWDKNGVRKPKFPKEDSLYFLTFRPTDARNFILNRSKKERIVIMNEAHTYPQHRTFVGSMLQGLYQNGFRYLGLEALHDTTINERKLPLVESGYYTREPEFGNLIAEALKLGFTLFGYDDFYTNGKEREIAQAKNIAAFLEKHPEGKVLIFCGHDHVIEGTPNNPSWEKAMAGRLKELTKIDPFTIDQTQLAEKSDQKYNHPALVLLDHRVPVVLLDKNGGMFNGMNNSHQFDCAVIHPKTHYENQRPHWLSGFGQKTAFKMNGIKAKHYPILILAYRENEPIENGVPADLVELPDKDFNTYLFLRKGNFKLVVKDKRDKIIQTLSIRIP